MYSVIARATAIATTSIPAKSHTFATTCWTASKTDGGAIPFFTGFERQSQRPMTQWQYRGEKANR